MAEFQLGQKVYLYYGLRRLPGEHVITNLSPKRVILDRKIKVPLVPAMLFTIGPVDTEIPQSTSDEMARLIWQGVDRVLEANAKDEEAFRERMQARHDLETSGEMTVEELLTQVDWKETARRNKARNG